VTLLIVLTTQIEAVSHSFHTYTTIEWCMISQIIRGTRCSCCSDRNLCERCCESVHCCTVCIV